MFIPFFFGDFESLFHFLAVLKISTASFLGYVSRQNYKNTALRSSPHRHFEGQYHIGISKGHSHIFISKFISILGNQRHLGS